jgi:hypothetical protein
MTAQGCGGTEDSCFRSEPLIQLPPWSPQRRLRPADSPLRSRPLSLKSGRQQGRTITVGRPQRTRVIGTSSRCFEPATAATAIARISRSFVSIEKRSRVRLLPACSACRPAAPADTRFLAPGGTPTTAPEKRLKGAVRPCLQHGTYMPYKGQGLGPPRWPPPRST